MKNSLEMPDKGQSTGEQSFQMNWLVLLNMQNAKHIA